MRDAMERWMLLLALSIAALPSPRAWSQSDTAKDEQASKIPTQEWQLGSDRVSGRMPVP